MKMRFPIVLTAFLTVFAVCGARAQAPLSPDPAKLRLASANVLVLDAQSGQPLYSKGAEEVTPIASLTKLMTAIVTIESGLPLDEALAVDMDDFDYLKGTRSRLTLGATLPRREMLQLALMSSENRAASTLARNYPGGVDAFVGAMNAKARALGMTRTRFEDPTGLSPNNVSTASDLARLVRASAQYPLIRDFSTTPSHYVEVQPTGRLLGFNNSNRLVSSADWDIQLQKTGYIREAGRCLVMLANVASKPMIIVLLDSIGKFTRLGDAQRVKYWLETGQTLPLAAAFGYKAPAARAVKSAKPRAAVKVKGKALAAQNSRSSRSARAGGA
ncbi:MAG: D-alanyl-D-alanine endopeptidase [Betaproteobacteria bacterium]|nr:D-alanyl-D-alanine endopeptidase [Betaproteobacteria bacterium]